MEHFERDFVHYDVHVRKAEIYLVDCKIMFSRNRHATFFSSHLSELSFFSNALRIEIRLSRWHY